MFGAINVADYKNNRHFNVRINASHVEISEHGKEIWTRTDPVNENSGWYDEKHIRIVRAMQELEKALLETVGCSY